MVNLILITAGPGRVLCHLVFVPACAQGASKICAIEFTVEIHIAEPYRHQILNPDRSIQCVNALLTVKIVASGGCERRSISMRQLARYL